MKEGREEGIYTTPSYVFSDGTGLIVVCKNNDTICRIYTDERKDKDKPDGIESYDSDYILYLLRGMGIHNFDCIRNNTVLMSDAIEKEKHRKIRYAYISSTCEMGLSFDGGKLKVWMNFGCSSENHARVVAYYDYYKQAIDAYNNLHDALSSIQDDLEKETIQFGDISENCTTLDKVYRALYLHEKNRIDREFEQIASNLVKKGTTINE